MRSLFNADDDILTSDEVDKAHDEFMELTQGLPFCDIQLEVGRCCKPGDLGELRKRICTLVDQFDDIVRNAIQGIITISQDETTICQFDGGGNLDSSESKEYIFSKRKFLSHCKLEQDLSHSIDLEAFFRHLCEKKNIVQIDGDIYKMTEEYCLNQVSEEYDEEYEEYEEYAESADWM